MMSEENRLRGRAKLEEIAGPRAAAALTDWRELAPGMEDYILGFVAGDVLSRPGLDAKTRQLVTISALCAMNHSPKELEMHLHGALNLGWRREELVEVLTQIAVFAGFPAALDGLRILKSVLGET